MTATIDATAIDRATHFNGGRIRPAAFFVPLQQEGTDQHPSGGRARGSNARPRRRTQQFEQPSPPPIGLQLLHVQPLPNPFHPLHPCESNDHPGQD